MNHCTDNNIVISPEMEFNNKEDGGNTAGQLAVVLILTLICLVIFIAVCSVISARKSIIGKKTKTTNREINNV